MGKDTANRPDGEGILGPGVLVAAAFVGPGTVMTALGAGAKFGGSLLWIVVVSLLLAILLQEMSARIGTLTGQGLGETLRRLVNRRPWMWAMAALIICAIGFGNAAYQTGNLMGAAVGMRIGMPAVTGHVLVIAIAVVASVLLLSGSYRLVERVLMAVVAVMGFAFVIAAIVAVISGRFSFGSLRPGLPAGSALTGLALLGTTIVPYNLFLHASGASRRWSKIRPRDKGLRLARTDAVLGISLGGIVTAAILILSASLLDPNVDADAMPSALAAELSTSRGAAFAPWFLALGLFAAGLTSAVTAPLAAAYAVCGISGWSTDEKSGRFRAIWGTVMLTGLVAALWQGKSPAETILFAQAANAVVLPVIGGFLLLVCNAKIFGKHANGRWSNIAAGLALLVIFVLSAWKLVSLAY